MHDFIISDTCSNVDMLARCHIPVTIYAQALSLFTVGVQKIGTVGLT